MKALITLVALTLVLASCGRRNHHNNTGMNMPSVLEINQCNERLYRTYCTRHYYVNGYRMVRRDFFNVQCYVRYNSCLNNGISRY